MLFASWFVGESDKKIPPFALLKAHHVNHLKDGGQKLRMMRAIFTLVEVEAERIGCWYEHHVEWTMQWTTDLWERVGPVIISKFGCKNRNMEISWKTVYNHMAQKRAFLKSAPPGTRRRSSLRTGSGQQASSSAAHPAATTTTDDNSEIDLADTIFETTVSV